MEFAYPAAFAGLALIPLLVLLNLWKYRRLRVEVGSLIIWKRLSQHAEAPSSSKQRYFNLSLLAQILVVVFLTAAVAGPRVTHPVSAGRTIHLVIDRSASTGADSAGSRVFDRITLGASRLINSLAEEDVVYCHSFPGLSGVETKGPLPPGDARGWLSALNPTQIAGNPTDVALQVAARASASTGQVFVFTDQLLSGIPDTVKVAVTPADEGNAAIMSAKVARDARGLHFFFRVANFSATPRTTDWTLTGASGRSYASSASAKLSIPAGASASLTVPLPKEVLNEEALQVSLVEDDALSGDNQAYVFRNPGPELIISLAGAQNKELLRALSSLPGASVALSETPGPECVLAVFNELSPPENLDCSAVVIAPPAGIGKLLRSSPNDYYTPAGPLAAKEWEMVTSPGWARTITIAKALKPVILNLSTASVVLEDGDVPLIVEFTHEGRRIIYIGFKLTDTNWTSQVSFPLFWGLLAERMHAARDEWITCSTGGFVAIPTRDLGDIVSPAGGIISHSAEGSRAILRPELVGLYRAHYPDGPRLLGISLFSPEESRLSSKSVPFDPSWLQPLRTQKPATAVGWLWQYFAFAAAIAMLASWLLWRERKKD